MEDVKALIKDYATRYGLDPGMMTSIASIESGFNPKAVNEKSKASGVFQFIPSTWKGYGGGHHPLDPNANIDAAMRLTRDNIKVLRSKLGREPTPGEVYLAHQQGAGGALRILTNGDKRAVDVVGHNEVLWNGGNAEMTASEFANLWSVKLAKHGGASAPIVAGLSPDVSSSGGDSNFTAGDVGRIGYGDLASAENMTREEELAAEKAADENKYGLIGGVGAAIYNEWSILAPFRGIYGFDSDPNFVLTEDVVREYGRDIPDQYLDEFAEAESLEHMELIRARLLEQMERNEKLANMGATGIGLQMAAAMFDPGAIAATIAIGAVTGGAGVAPAVAARFGRVGSVALGAAEGAIANVATEGALMAVDPTRENSALMFALGSGLLMGGAYGALRHNPAVSGEAEKLVQIGQDMQSKALGKVPDTASSRSAGAAGVASVPGLTKDAISDATMIEQAAKHVEAVFGKVRFDVTAQYLKSKNPFMRLIGRHFFEDAVRAKPGQVTEIAATEIQRRMHDVNFGSFAKGYSSGFNKWMKDNGISRWRQNSVRKKFDEEVFAYVTSRNKAAMNVSDAVKEAADSYTAMMKTYLKEAKDAGLYDGDGVEGYVSRYLDVGAASRMIDEFGYVNGGLSDFFKAAIKAAQPTLDDHLAGRYGQAIVRRMHETRAGAGAMDPKLMSFSADDLEEVLDGYLSKQDIRDIKASMDLMNDPGKGSTRLRSRITMDENFEADIKDLNGVTRRVKMSDFYVRDMFAVGQLYSRHMSGQVTLANLRIFDPETGDLIQDGFRTADDWQRFKARVRAVGDVKGADWEADEKNLDFFYHVITGTPYRGRDEGGEFDTFVRMLGSYNYMRVMNQVGIAQLPELGLVAGRVGFKALFAAVPEFRRIVTSLRNGTYSDDLAEEVATVFGAGQNMLRHRYHTDLNEFGAPIQQGGDRLMAKANMRFGSKLHAGGKITSYISLMGPIHDNMQRWASRAIVIKFGDMARGKSRVNVNRLKAMGLDDKMIERVFKELREKASYHPRKGDPKGGRLKALNIHTWDAKVAAAFESAVFREINSAVVANDPGQMAKWMSHPVGRLILQFRNFALGSHTKTFLQSLNHRDREAAIGALLSMGIGSLVYAAQTRINLIGDADADDKIEDRLSVDRLAVAGLVRSSFSGLMPMGVDMIARATVGEPVLDYRTSGVASDVILGMPASDLFNSANQATSGVITGLFGDDYSREDASALRRVLPWQNAMGVTQVANAILSGLPAREIKDY